MKFLDYKENTKRTLPDLGSLLNNSIHMVLGLGSEIEELYAALENDDFVNVGEELSDGNWYATNYCNIHGIVPNYFPVKLAPYLDIECLKVQIIKLVNITSKLMDLDKKLLAYNKPVQLETRRELIQDYLMELNLAYSFAGIDAEKSMENNIGKLKARFPEKFDEHRANNRDLVSERIELEK